MEPLSRINCLEKYEKKDLEFYPWELVQIKKGPHSTTDGKVAFYIRTGDHKFYW